MNLHLSLSIAPIIALIAGILILIVPRLLNFIVAIYLIITGLLGLFPHRVVRFTCISQMIPARAPPFGLPRPVQASQPAWAAEVAVVALADVAERTGHRRRAAD